MAFSAGVLCLAALALAAPTDAAVRVSGLRASGLTGDPAGNPPDGYVKVWCNGVSGGRTETIKDKTSPAWAAQFNFPDCTTEHYLKIEVWDQDLVYDDHLGTCIHGLKSGNQTEVACHTWSGGTVYFNVQVK